MCMYTYVRVSMYIYTCFACMSISEYVSMCKYMYMCLCVYVYVYMCMCTYMCVCKSM